MPVKRLRKVRPHRPAPRWITRGCDGFVARECTHCRVFYWVPVRAYEHRLHLRGRLPVQEAYPHLHPRVQELMTANAQCHRCWAKKSRPGPLAPWWRRWARRVMRTVIRNR